MQLPDAHYFSGLPWDLHQLSQAVAVEAAAVEAAVVEAAVVVEVAAAAAVVAAVVVVANDDDGDLNLGWRLLRMKKCCHLRLRICLSRPPSLEAAAEAVFEAVAAAFWI